MTATIDDYRLTTGALLSQSAAHLRRIAFQADLDVRNRYAVYPGLDRSQTAAAARLRRDDALFVLSLKAPTVR